MRLPPHRDITGIKDTPPVCRMSVVCPQNGCTDARADHADNSWTRIHFCKIIVIKLRQLYDQVLFHKHDAAMIPVGLIITTPCSIKSGLLYFLLSLFQI